MKTEKDNKKKSNLPIFSVMKSVCANKYDCYYQTIDFKCNAGDMKCKHKQTAS